MIKEYITILPQETMTVSLLGRNVTLTHNEIVKESNLTETFPRFFKELKEGASREPRPYKDTSAPQEEQSQEEILTEVSTQVEVTQEPQEFVHKVVNPIKKTNRKK